LPRKKRSTPATRIVATPGGYHPQTQAGQPVSVESIFPDEGEDAPLADALERGLALIQRGEFFAAHEELELAWRAAESEERDFFQGLVHVAVAWYQAGRRNPVGCQRQLEKAARRLGPYAPAHRGLDVADLLRQVEAAHGRFPDLPPVRLRRA
jgi:predicted metal-dependent hydrolase